MMLLYKHLANEQRARYLKFRRENPRLSEEECQKTFYSQIHEMNLSKIIVQEKMAHNLLIPLGPFA